MLRVYAPHTKVYSFVDVYYAFWMEEKYEERTFQCPKHYLSISIVQVLKY
jgi:hypothetical protein